MSFCINCGKKIKLPIDKCPYCGTNLRDLLTTNISTENQKESDNIPPAPKIKRIFAGIFDLVFGIGIALILWQYAGRRMLIAGKLRWTLFRLFIPFLPAIYFTLKDSFKGKSFGKLIFGLTTFNLDRNRPADMVDSFLRNAIFAIVAIPFLGWLAFLIFVFITGIQIFLGRSQRIGEGFAHTRVIEDKFLDLLLK